MSTLGGLSPLRALHSPVNQTNGYDFNWLALQRSQSASSTVFENHIFPPHLLNSPQVLPPDPIPDAQLITCDQEQTVADEGADGASRPKRKSVAPVVDEATRRNRNRLTSVKYRLKRKKYISTLESDNAQFRKKIEEFSRTLVEAQEQVVKLTGRVADLSRELEQQKALLRIN